MQKKLLAVIFFLVCGHASAQLPTMVGVEAGFTSLVSTSKLTDNIRPIGSYSSGVWSSFNLYHGGMKLEKGFSKKFSFSTGLQYALSNSLIEGTRHYTNNASSAFFYEYKNDETVIEYFTINEIRQRTQYLNIPVGLRFYPFGFRTFTVYFKAGVFVLAALATNTDVGFADPKMQPYEGEVLHESSTPQTINMFGELGAGVRVGKMTRTSVGLEVNAPSFWMTKSAGMLCPGAGTGIQINVLMPLTKKQIEK